MQKQLIRIALLLCLVWSGRAFAQNLVPNGDFEQHAGCPTANDQITVANYWHSLDTVSQYSQCAPDYCHPCANSVPTSDQAWIPNNREFWQYPHSRTAVAKVRFDTPDTTAGIYYGQYRDYLQGKLISRLSVGKQYCVSFWVNLAECAGYGIKDISAYFDDGSIDTTTQCFRAQSRYTPQVTNQGGVITDTMRWVKIEGAFVANGKEQFITIGNFKDEAHTTSLTVPRNRKYAGIVGDSISIYLVDDVCVVPSDTKADAGPDTHTGFGDSVYIGRPMASAIWCDWRVLGNTTVIGQGPGIWVKPKAATSYVVTQTLCGVVTKDTVKVDVWKLGAGSSVRGQTQQYGISPNPNSGVFRIGQAVAQNEVVDMTMYNVVGQRMYSGRVAFKEGSAVVEMSGIPDGTYYLHLRGASGDSYELRMVKE